MVWWSGGDSDVDVFWVLGSEEGGRLADLAVGSVPDYILFVVSAKE